jgi:hypothetical protein
MARVSPRTVAYVVAGSLAVVALVFAGVTTRRALTASPSGAPCTYQDVGPVVAPAGTMTLGPRTPTQVVKIVFDASRDAETATIDFQSQDALPLGRGTDMHVDIGEFTRSDGHRFPAPPSSAKDGTPVSVAATATVTGRTTVRLTVCLDPDRPHRASPGTYVGSVALDDDALASPVLATISASLKYPDFYGPLVLSVVAAVAAAYLIAMADPNTKFFQEWFRDHEHLSAIAYGLAGALAAYGAVYLRSF